MRYWILSSTVSLLVAASSATASDWESWADLETIEVITASEDDTAKETTIWIVVSEGSAYIRTSRSSSWGNAMAAAGQADLRGEAATLTVHPTLITDESHLERLTDAFREKYGFSDLMIGLVRGEARIWRVDAVSP